MSFILDALKKSEAERQRQNAPGFANVPDARARKSPHKWIWLVALLLGINLAALLGVLYMANRGPEAIVATTPVAAGNNQQSAATFSEIVAEAKRTQPAADAETTTPESASAGSTPVAGPAAAASLPSAVSESYDTFDDLQTRGALSLPDLHLDIHVFSGEPADRFVFINMTKYRENSKLSEGPVIKQITADGVVLEYQGTDFLLPRE
jgi:general secretion pathway protein B